MKDDTYETDLEIQNLKEEIFIKNNVIHDLTIKLDQATTSIAKVDKWIDKIRERFLELELCIHSPFRKEVISVCCAKLRETLYANEPASHWEKIKLANRKLRDAGIIP